MIFFGEKPLRYAISEVERIYNHECPHQGLENKIILPNIKNLEGRGVIECRNPLGGMMNY
jgi:hypothetical protein